MTSKELLLDQYTATFDEENWFVPLTKSLEDLTPEQASSSNGNNHSIKELVNHLIFWNERYLTRFKGNVPEPMKDDNSETFKDAKAKVENMNWESVVDKLKSVLNELRERIKEADESKLASHPIKDFDATWYTLIENINIHHAYHVGQIVCLRKMQGSWNPDKGVK